MGHNNQLWNRLISAHLIQKNSPQHEELQQIKENTSPWTIKMLLAVCGWLGAVFILGFVFMLSNDLFDEPITIGLLGLALVIAAYFIIRTPKNDFFEHVGLAVSLAGQALVVFAFMDSANNSLNWIVIGLFHVVLATVMPNMVHRVFSAFFSAISFDIGCSFFGAPHMVSSVALIMLVVLYINEFKTINTYQRVSGVIYGLVIYWLTVHCFVPLNVDIVDVLSSRSQPIFELPIEVIQGTFIAAIMFSLWTLLRANKLSWRSKPALIVLGMTCLFCLLTMSATGISAAIVIIVLGFSRSNRVMMGLGIIALIVYCSVYYYMMEETLLYKSGVLFVISVVMLFSRFILLKFWSTVEEL